MAKTAKTQKQKDAIAKRASIKKALKQKEADTKARLAAEDAAAKAKAKASKAKVVKNGKDVEDAEAPLEIFSDANSHVALRFYEGDTYTEAVIIGDGGCVDILKMTNREFAHVFTQRGVIGSKDVYEAAGKLLAVAGRAKAPCSERAVFILKEIVMAAKAKKKVTTKQLKGATAKAAASKATKAAASGKKPVARGQGIGAFVEEQLKAKKSTEEVLEAVKKKFPDAKTTPASVAWYRNKLRESGDLPKA